MRINHWLLNSLLETKRVRNMLLHLPQMLMLTVGQQVRRIQSKYSRAGREYGVDLPRGGQY